MRAGRTGGASSIDPFASPGCGSAHPGSSRPRASRASSSTRDALSGPAAHATTRACIELLASVERGSLLDAGCGSGVVAVAAVRLGFGPVHAVDIDPVAVDVARETVRLNGVAVAVRCADAVHDAVPPTDVVVANIELAAVEALLGRTPAAVAITSGYLVGDRPRAEGWERRRARRDRWLGGRRARAARTKLGVSMASFSVGFLGCKVSYTDAQAVRERLLRDGHIEVESGGDVAVVNTCCVTHEAVSKSRQALSRAARTHARVYVTGCGANLEGALSGLPETSRSSRARARRRLERSPATSARSRACRRTLASSGRARS